jgi:hypothetical protein
MIDRRALIQDLRAEAHTVPPRIGQLMRAAAAELEGSDLGQREDDAARHVRLFDASPSPIPIHPPEA